MSIWKGPVAPWSKFNDVYVAPGDPVFVLIAGADFKKFGFLQRDGSDAEAELHRFGRDDQQLFSTVEQLEECLDWDRKSAKDADDYESAEGENLKEEVRLQKVLRRQIPDWVKEWKP